MKKYEFIASTETFYLEVPDELDTRLTDIAEARGVTKVDLILEALKNYLEMEEKTIFPEKS